ncbi:MAG TPA: DNA polymerase III subunit chi [Novosphingobium sp.]|nr:DNA polymerase III subunit chi [Novosphingobium sp.]
MRVDFYQLGESSADAALALIARATLSAGERLLVVSGDDAQLARISDTLWAAKPETFLAHGLSGGSHDDRQPILLSDQLEACNQAKFVAFADGQWRDGADSFERVFLLFDAATLDSARGVWRMVGEREGVERRFWKQEAGKWVEGP